MSEGWADFIALHMQMRDGDDPHGTYSNTVYAATAFRNSAYFGDRRYPYSIDFGKNPLTLRHIQNGEPLPSTVPMQPNDFDNAEEHNAGEV